MDEPLVSVIIPVYNTKRYLTQCLESVVQQTYQNLDILIIDDGSTDGSSDICDEFAQKDKRIRVYHTENHGLASVRNFGVCHAGGTYISFLDSDDWIEAKTIETMLKAAIQNAADVVTAKICSEYIDQTVHPTKQKESYLVFCGQDVLAALANGMLSNNTWNKLYRSDCLSNIHYPDGHNYEDVATTWILMNNLANNGGKIIVLAEELFHYRIRKNSISHTKSAKNLLDRYDAYREKYEGLTNYQGQLLASVINAIGSVWIYYGGLSREDRTKMTEKMQEMRCFSKDHFLQVITGKYSYYTKIFCLISQRQIPALMWLYYNVNRVYKTLLSKQKKMFE